MVIHYALITHFSHNSVEVYLGKTQEEVDRKVEEYVRREWTKAGMTEYGDNDLPEEGNKAIQKYFSFFGEEEYLGYGQEDVGEFLPKIPNTFRKNK